MYVYGVMLATLALVFFHDMKFLVSAMVIVVLLCIPLLTGSFSHSMFYHSYWLAADNLSLFLVILCLWITMLMILSMKKANGLEKLYFCFTVLNFMLVSAFLSSSLLGFYMFFELSLMPTLLIMLGWGSQPERIRAGSYLMIYTLVGSLPLLGCIMYMDFHCGSVKTFITSVEMFFFNNFDYSILSMLWMLAFLMKLPIYGVHLWLPKAHVEAPVAGSMVLAGMLLKLGAYGLMRSLRFMDLDLCLWSNMLFMWSLLSMCLVGLMCFRQCDLKSLVAYSSVAHMSLMLLGCFSCDFMGVKGLMSMLMSHGLCSSGLFFGVQCLYENSNSRSMFMNRGWLCLSPFFCLFWFLLCVGNASAPPCLNLLSEFFLISSIVSFGGWISSSFCVISVFLGGLFSMYLYTLVCHGKWSKSKAFWPPQSMRKYFVLFLHSAPLYGLLFLANYIFYLV